MNQKTPVNKVIIEKRMGKDFYEYIDICIDRIETTTSLLSGLGDLIDPDLKEFVKKRLKSETIQLLKMYSKFPLFSQEQ